LKKVPVSCSSRQKILQQPCKYFYMFTRVLATKNGTSQKATYGLFSAATCYYKGMYITIKYIYGMPSASPRHTYFEQIIEQRLYQMYQPVLQKVFSNKRLPVE
jgi:hypothetical protein